ncbi:MAG: hypothetical protein M3N18_00415 [Actinomycetota bacterium]|nr:hypothetical protein [Actinomycetota bacterium]
MYREVIAHAVREQRPHAEVSTAEPKDLDDETKRLAAHLVVCHLATGAVREFAKSWVDLEVRPGPGSLDANVKVDSRPASKVEQAEIGDVLAALDERLIGCSSRLRGRSACPTAAASVPSLFLPLLYMRARIRGLGGTLVGWREHDWVFFDDFRRSGTRGERLTRCPGCGERLARQNLEAVAGGT